MAVARLGREVPPWDFRVPGVTAMTCDLHKYGFVPKGASVVLHSTSDWTQHQAFFYDDWPSGVYWSPAVAGALTIGAALFSAFAFSAGCCGPTCAAFCAFSHGGI